MEINVILVLLGKCCRITNTIIELKLNEKTSLFECYASENFKDILTILDKVVNNVPVEITTGHYQDNDYLANTEIRTTHYPGTSFETFKRRSDRFIEELKLSTMNNKKIMLFIREDDSVDTTKEDLQLFDSLIKKVNPECDYRFLLTSSSNVPKIQLEKVLHENYAKEKEKYLEYIQITLNLT